MATPIIRYDGTSGADAFVGSNSSLIAPVRIGRGANVTAGSVITEDVPAGAVAFGRARQVTKKARVTLVWNGEKVIDDAEIPNGTALDPGPLLLQGDHGKVTFRNIKIKPLSGK